MLLERLLQLRIPHRLLEEAALDAGELVVYDLHGKVWQRVVTDAASSCFKLRRPPHGVPWPRCLPPLMSKEAGWLPCAQGAGEHLIVPILAPEALLGWIITCGLPRTSSSPGRFTSLERLLAIVVAEIRAAVGAAPREGAERGMALPELVGESAVMHRVRDEIRRALNVPFPVLIEGETGTGKDLVAWLLHDRSARRAGPYVALNCAAIPEGLLETELFGHQRGAFSGADRDRSGLLMAARGGTLFLDEVGELSLAAQAKLLRAVESGEVLPVGAVRAVHTDARIIAATNVDLEAAVHAGSFRRDLYYRLCVLHIHIPPLRERRDDIPLLTWHVLRSVCQRLDLPLRGLSREVLAAFAATAWPGNIRQLIHEIERAVISCEEQEIGIQHLSPELQAMDFGQQLSFVEMGKRVLEGWERAEIHRGLERTGWNVARLARDIGLSKRALFGRIARYGLRRPRQEEIVKG